MGNTIDQTKEKSRSASVPFALATEAGSSTQTGCNGSGFF